MTSWEGRALKWLLTTQALQPQWCEATLITLHISWSAAAAAEPRQFMHLPFKHEALPSDLFHNRAVSMLLQTIILSCDPCMLPILLKNNLPQFK